MKELKQDYTMKDYVLQIVVIGGLAAGIAYLYFYSLIMVAVYGGLAIAFIPYLAYLRSKRIYSEYIFEQIQVYTTNVIIIKRKLYIFIGAGAIVIVYSRFCIISAKGMIQYEKI